MIPYHANIDDLIYLECELDCSVEWQNGEPVVSIDSIIVDGINLEQHPTKRILFAMIAATIRQQAEQDDSVIEQAIADAGISYTGHPNDPHSRWVQA